MPNRVCGVLILAWCIVIAGVSCGGGPTTPDPPPPPPTKYKHEVNVKVERTLHYGVPVTSGLYDVTMRSNGKQFLNTPLGTKVTLDETTSRIEKCDVLVRVPGCLPSEFRNLDITNNDLEVKDVAYLGDFDHAYMLLDVLTYKVNGKGKNTSWINTMLNGSANPDGKTGLRLDQGFIDSIKEAILDFRDAGKRFVGTPYEEIYIKTYTFNDLGNNVHGPTSPPNGEFWTFRETQYPGVSNITYPTSFVNVASSKMFVNQSSASTIASYREAFDALIGDGQEIGDFAKFFACVPLLMWRPRDGNDYWIDSEKESREGVDPISGTTINAYAQQYVVLERAQYTNPLTPVSDEFINNPGIGLGGIDYNVPIGKPHFARGLPLRPSERQARGDARGEIRR